MYYKGLGTFSLILFIGVMITAATNLIILFDNQKQTEFTRLAVISANETQADAAKTMNQSNENGELIQNHSDQVIQHAKITSETHNQEINLLKEILNQTRK